MRTFVSSLAVSLVIGTLVAACGGTDGSEVNGGNGANGTGANGTGANGSGGTIMLGNGANGTGGSSMVPPGTVIDPKSACATGTANASLSGVNMYVMFDRSSSMSQEADDAGNTRWELTSAALDAFFKSPSAGGLGLALRFFPHDMPQAGCNQQECSVAACQEPLVGLGQLTADAAPTDAHEKLLVDATAASAPGMAGAGTPISAALGGALDWAKAQHALTPDQNTVVVLVTDGQPNGCDTDIDVISKLASDALAADGTRTYAIGLTGSAEDDMNSIAMAGGTDKGIFVADGADTQQQLLDALGNIRGQILDCDFAMPTPKPGVQVDKDKINVNYTPSGGAQTTLAQVANEGACTAGGWYYDNFDNPSRIILCKSTCDTVTADPKAALEILLGCGTVSEVPK